MKKINKLKYIFLSPSMSKGPKVDLAIEETGKSSFENTPKLFSKWSYDEVAI